MRVAKWHQLPSETLGLQFGGEFNDHRWQDVGGGTYEDDVGNGIGFQVLFIVGSLLWAGWVVKVSCGT